MNGMLPYSHGTGLKRARILSCTNTSFTAPVCTRTRPLLDDGTATARVAVPAFSTQKDEGPVHNQVILYPFGVGTDTQTFTFRVIGWKLVKASSTVDVWFPSILAAFDCALCPFVGLAGCALSETDKAVDTITRVAALGSDLSSEVFSPANDTPGWIVLDLKGSAYWEPTFDMTGATSGNVLYGYL